MAQSISRGQSIIGALSNELLAYASYLVKHNSLALGIGLGATAWNRVLHPKNHLDAAGRKALKTRLRALFLRDIQNVRDGYYPPELLAQFPLSNYLRVFPTALTEFPKIWRRKKRQGFEDLPSEINLQDYPPYYRRTFHWQTDGWLSVRSAELYDAGVEFLFGGTADIMRRMVIPPLVDATRSLPNAQILDVACGTGRFIQQASAALPTAQFTGLDLSPYYLKFARQNANPNSSTHWVQGPGESMPLPSKHYDAIVSIFLFHELPKNVRREVVKEMFRVLKVGGTAIVLDSAQVTDSAELSKVLNMFPETYHEPYYKSYLRDDLGALMEECGFRVVDESPAFVSRLVTAQKLTESE